jgi:hypothetical protein
MQDGNATEVTSARTAAEGLLPLIRSADNVVAACPEFAPVDKVLALALDDTVTFRARVEILCAAANVHSPPLLGMRV